MVSTPCKDCNSGTMTEQRQRRGGFLGVFGWILLVASILGTCLFSLVAIAVFTMGDDLYRRLDSVVRMQTHAAVEELHVQVEAYRKAHGSLPEDLDVLLERDPLHGNRPWASRSDLIDPWQEPLELRRKSDTQFEIVSSGSNDLLGVRAGRDPLQEITSGRPLDLEAAQKSIDPTESAEFNQLAKNASLVALVISIVAGIVGWLIVRKRTVLACDRCGTVVPAA